MFDLHLHTNLSDGELSVNELLEMLNNLGISTFSITDHNHALAYNYINSKDYPGLITGTEIATSYQGRIIEILGYNINPQVINDWYLKFYSESNLIKNENELWHRLVNISQEINMPLTNYTLPEKIVKGCSKKTAFKYLTQYNEFEFKTYKEFFRKGLSNPESPWYVAEDNLYPSLQETIDLIHKANGIAILAHPYEYGLDDLDSLFKACIIKGIDGIECFHPSCSMYNSINITKMLDDKQLLGSGGSDYHRNNKFVKAGVYASKDLLKANCFKWIKGE